MTNHKRLDTSADICSQVYNTYKDQILDMLANDQLNWIVLDLSKMDTNCLTKYFNCRTIRSLELFQVPAGSSTGIKSTSNKLTYCYMMVPILGVNHLTVSWFRSKGAGNLVNNELVFDKDQCLEIERVELKDVSLIKTYSPYEIKNPNPYKSIVLAVKLDPEPIELFDEGIFATLVK